MDLNGVIGGGQFGWNVQSGAWVYGLESDLQGSAEKDRQSLASTFFYPILSTTPLSTTPFVTGTALTAYEAKISWFGTLRGRLGYAWNSFLFYGTGGLAYGGVKLSGVTSVSGAAGGTPFAYSTAFGGSKTNLGWTLGLGVEGAIG